MPVNLTPHWQLAMSLSMTLLCTQFKVCSLVLFLDTWMDDAVTCICSDPNDMLTEGQVKVGDIVGFPLDKVNNMCADCLDN